jgi:hypothetical protein
MRQQRAFAALPRADKHTNRQRRLIELQGEIARNPHAPTKLH